MTAWKLAHVHMHPKVQLRTQQSASHIPGGQLVSAEPIVQPRQAQNLQCWRRYAAELHA